MKAATVAPGRTARGPAFADRATARLVGAAALSIALLAVLFPAWAVDARLIEGMNPWTKVQKFSLSFVVHFLTLAVLSQQLPARVRGGFVWGGTTILVVAAFVFEMIYVVAQAARGRMSHFNYETPIESLLYAAMGLGALIIVAGALVLGILIWWRGEGRPGLRWGAVIGLIWGSVLTVVLASYMSSVHGDRWVGTHPDGGATWPLFGWSREVGDLRPAHFLALHLMQTVPLLGWVFDEIGVGKRVALLGVAALAVLQTGAAIAIFFWALDGRPIWPV